VLVWQALPDAEGALPAFSQREQPEAQDGDLIPRPWCCPEPRCDPLWQLRDGDAQPLDIAQPGQTWSCWGRLSAEVLFTYDGVEHANDLKSCHYTALKGVVAYQENRADWEALAGSYRSAVLALDRASVHGVAKRQGLTPEQVGISRERTL
jgi:hypothetical protein